MVVSGAVPNPKQTKIRLFQILCQRNRITGKLDDHRVISRSSEGNSLSVAIHIVIHGLRIFDDPVPAEQVNLRVAIDLHGAATGALHPNIIREMTGSDFKFPRKRLAAILRQNLIGGYVSLNFCLIVIGNVRAVRKAMMVRAHFKREPVLIISGIINIPENKAAALVIIVFFLENFDAGNILLVSGNIGIRKGIVCHTGAVNDSLCNILSVIADGLRRICQIQITRNQRPDFRLSGLGILHIHSIAESVFRCESELI